ncbi:hypothetical protein SAMN05192534_101419 [Alteribacillus persepolensis]|uniref:Uncharacterized protein n=1 Tax=Alteribacillus persepolensis TaxID=568899 RepID=A0A1G7Z626_9BACI|nr:hypothetical protein [Alteribacillus persepolensis]SDH04201.1 hypothetical protein SAMN05192534_101419 [Alteribacillus persepolensis]
MDKNIEEKIIKSYQEDEQMMILVFAQWCINHGLDPHDMYKRAYPSQEKNAALDQAAALTVPKEEAGDIADDTVLGVLSLYGNDELAHVVAKEMKKK